MASGTKQGQESVFVHFLNSAHRFIYFSTLLPPKFRIDLSLSLSVLVFGSIDEIDPFRGESFVAFLLFVWPFTVNSRSSFRSRSLMKMRAQGRGGGERIIRKFGLAERRPKMRSTRVGNLWMCKRERETERVQSSLTRCRLLIRFLLSNFVLVY